jgi:HK97 family phage major capsid protein
VAKTSKVVWHHRGDTIANVNNTGRPWCRRIEQADQLGSPDDMLGYATSRAASWLPETGPGTDSDQSFDSFTLIPKRIAASTVVSRQLILQSSPDIESFVANDISKAIGVAVDNAALNGSGAAPQPRGILNVPANASGAYLYDQSLS